MCVYSKVIRSWYFGIWFGIFPTRKQAWTYHHKAGMSFVYTLSSRNSSLLPKYEIEICYQNYCVTLQCHAQFIQNGKLPNTFYYHLEKIPVFDFTGCIQQFFTDLCQSWLVFFFKMFFSFGIWILQTQWKNVFANLNINKMSVIKMQVFPLTITDHKYDGFWYIFSPESMVYFTLI